MASASLFVGLDVGTQGTKGLVLDLAAGAVVARASAAYGLIEGLPPGAAEQHPQTWIDAVRTVLGRLLTEVDRARLGGIAVSGQQHGFVPLDDRERVIRPAKLWCDTSTEAEARELSERFERHVPVGYTASKILWLARREPEHFARLRTVLLPHDYVNLRLTGRRTMEAGDASGTGFFDPRARAFAWHEAEVIHPELPAMLPELVEAGEPAGRVDARAAADFGLPEGLVVASGGGDNMLSAIGAGATRPGVVVMSLGTSGTVCTHATEPVVDPEGLIAPFCDSTGGWLPLLCVMNLTGVTEEVRAAFGVESGEALARLTEEAARVPAGCDGVTFLPYLQGERVPDLPGATGTLLGLRPGSLRPATLFRAALEGTSLNLAWGVDRMRALGVAVDAVRLVGGGARNPLWRQILADSIGTPIVALAEPESAALGAALQAAWTTCRSRGDSVAIDDLAVRVVALPAESVEPRAPEVERYRELGEVFRERVAALHGARAR